MTNEFKSANSVKTGKKFTDKRLQMDCSFSQIAEMIYVNKNYLVAIEKGDYSIFPSESFAKAYFKKYVKYLNIDCEFPSVFEQQIQKKHQKKSNDIIFVEYRKKGLKYALILSGLVIIYITINLFTRDQSNKEDELMDNFQGYGQVIEHQEDIVSKTLDSEASVRGDLDDDIYQQSESLVSNPNNYKDKDQEKNMLVLQFVDECWVEIYLQDVLIEAQFFKNGDKFSKKIDSVFKIVVGNADSVNGTFNSEDIDFITNANRLTRVSTIHFRND